MLQPLKVTIQHRSTWRNRFGACFSVAQRFSVVSAASCHAFLCFCRVRWDCPSVLFSLFVCFRKHIVGGELGAFFVVITPFLRRDVAVQTTCEAGRFCFAWRRVVELLSGSFLVFWCPGNLDEKVANYMF